METAVGIAIGLVAGSVLTVLGAIVVVRLQSKRLSLGYEVLSANVIIPKLRRANPAVRIAVRKSALAPEHLSADADAFVDVDELYGFRIRIQNCGNQVLQDQPVTFRFEEPTRIIMAEAETAPEFHGRLPEIGIANSKREVTISLPFLNPGQRAVVSIQTVFNPDLSCQTVAAGPGLTTHDMGIRFRILTTSIWAAGMLLLAGGAGTTKGIAHAGVTPEAVAGRLDNAGNVLVTSLVTVGLLAPVFLEPLLRNFLRKRGGRDGRA